MKVWIVQDVGYGCDGHVCAVFDSKEKAEQFIKDDPPISFSDGYQTYVGSPMSCPDIQEREVL